MYLVIVLCFVYLIVRVVDRIFFFILWDGKGGKGLKNK